VKAKGDGYFPSPWKTHAKDTAPQRGRTERVIWANHTSNIDAPIFHAWQFPHDGLVKDRMNVILGKTMKRAFFVLICFPLFGSMAMAEKNGIKFNDLGITLYGKFNFESEGEMFVVENTADRKQLVPAGAVLTCIRSAYTIGYF
jgi:hypothetical protein